MIKSGVDEQKVQRKSVTQRQTFAECWPNKSTVLFLFLFFFFLTAAHKAICLRSEPFNRSTEPKFWEPTTSSPGRQNHPRSVRCQQWEWVLAKSGNVNQKKDAILAENPSLGWLFMMFVLKGKRLSTLLWEGIVLDR